MRITEDLANLIDKFFSADDAAALMQLVKSAEITEYGLITHIVDYIIENSAMPGTNVRKMIDESSERMIWRKAEIMKMMEMCEPDFIKQILGLFMECSAINIEELKNMKYNEQNIAVYETIYKKPAKPAAHYDSYNSTVIYNASAVPAGAVLKNCNITTGSITAFKQVIGGSK